MIAMYTMPSCECNEELEFDFCGEPELDGDVVLVHSYGHCPKCERKYKWLDCYNLSSWGELKELEDED